MLEEVSEMTQHGQDFFVAYSPERVNPGDKVNTIETIVKVVGRYATIRPSHGGQDVRLWSSKPAPIAPAAFRRNRRQDH